MVKYFCDKCGREIPEDGRFNVHGMKAISSLRDMPDADFAFAKMLCEDCFDEVLVLIGGDENE